MGPAGPLSFILGEDLPFSSDSLPLLLSLVPGSVFTEFCLGVT